jgi:hypothetical protein
MPERALRFPRRVRGGVWSGTAVPYSPQYTRGFSETPPTFSLRKEPLVRRRAPVGVSLGRSIRSTRTPHAALAARRGIFVRRRFPWGGSDSSRCRSRLRMPRFFAVAASVAICRLAQHEKRLARGTHACGVIPTNRSRRLLTPCALRLGGPHLTSQPLTPSVAPWVLPRDLRSRVRRSGSRLSSGVDAPHVARTPDDVTRLRATPPMSPGCLPSVQSRSCDRAKPSAFPVTFARKSSHLSHPMRVSASRRDPSPHRATPCNLGLPRGSPRWRGEDASLRPLQPTVDTSTRRPFDFRARSLRCTDRRMLPLLPLSEASGSSVRRRTALRQSDPG